MQATAFDPDAPLNERRAVIRCAEDAVEMVELTWGVRYQDRQGAVIRRGAQMAWLDLSVAPAQPLEPLPAGSFTISEVGRGSAPPSLNL